MYFARLNYQAFITPKLIKIFMKNLGLILVLLFCITAKSFAQTSDKKIDTKIEYVKYVFPVYGLTSEDQAKKLEKEYLEKSGIFYSVLNYKREEYTVIVSSDVKMRDLIDVARLQHCKTNDYTSSEKMTAQQVEDFIKLNSKQ